MPGFFIGRRRRHEYILVTVAGKSSDVAANSVGVQAYELTDCIEVTCSKISIERIVVDIAADLLYCCWEDFIAGAAIEYGDMLPGTDCRFHAGERDFTAAPDVEYSSHRLLARIHDMSAAARMGINEMIYILVDEAYIAIHTVGRIFFKGGASARMKHQSAVAHTAFI